MEVLDVAAARVSLPVIRGRPLSGSPRSTDLAKMGKRDD